MKSWQLLQGDALEVLRTLPAESVQMCVTSPPYWGLRDYSRCDCAIRRTTHPHGGPPEHNADETAGTFKSEPNPSCPKCHGTGSDPDVKERQIGLEKTPEEYVARLVEVFREVRRVLRDDGTLWLNIGDCYAGSWKAGNNPEYQARHTNMGKTTPDTWGLPVGTPNGLKPKDLLGLPWRVAFALQADGWWLRSDIVWSKPNPMPESVTDRPTRSHEFLFLLAKSARYYYDADAIREPVDIEKWGLNKDGSYTGVPLKDYDAAGVQNPKTIKLRIAARAKTAGLLTPRGRRPAPEPGEPNAFHPFGRNKRSVWRIPTESFEGAHFATFPKAMVEPCVKAGTSEHGACSVCGAPWEREVEKERFNASYWGQAGVTNEEADGMGKWGGKTTRGGDIRLGPSVKTTTIGWSPTCPHTDAIPVPCAVLDPFAGSGTAGVVALSLGRRFLGIEIKTEYIEMARKRLEEFPVPLSAFAAPVVTA